MNFKTTIVLIILLFIVAGTLWWTGRSPSTPPPTQTPTIDQGTRLLDVQTNNVNALSLTDAAGQQTTLHKYGDTWRLTAPVAAAAVDWSTKDLVRTIAEVRSAGRPAEAPDSGLSSPRYRLTLSTDDGKTINIAIGNRAGPDLMYAQVDGGDVNLIDSSLEKTLKTAATELRDKHLLDVKDFQVKQFRISYATTRVSAEQVDGKWKILEPTQMPGDDSAISALLSAITGAEASEFLKPDSDELAFARFNQPTYTAWLSTAAPTTQPATRQGAQAATTAPSNPVGGVTLLVGASDSLANDHYFVQLPDGQAAKIAKDTLDGMEKTALDLRDKNVLNIASDDVKQISIIHETWPAPTTQPASRPSMEPISSKMIVLDRRAAQKPPALGPPAPATMPTTGPTTMAAATQPATQPEEQPSVWQFKSPYDAKTAVDDSKVTTLLAKFQPLAVEKYLVKVPDAPPLDRYTIVIKTAGESMTLELVKPSGGGNPYGTYNDLTFEVSPQIFDPLDADFRKTPG